jgi:Domain of unknown function (DUF1841)
MVEVSSARLREDSGIEIRSLQNARKRSGLGETGLVHTPLVYCCAHGVEEMDDDELAKLRKLTGQLDKLTYEAVKADTVNELPDENQLFARAMQEHMHLKHIHNALEFADLRERVPYEIEFQGDVVSPLAHVAVHAAVKGQVEQAPEVRAAFEKMVATGTPAHHAQHVLGALLAELMWETSRASEEAASKAKARYDRSIQKLCGDSAFRKKMTRRFGSSHSAFE